MPALRLLTAQYLTCDSPADEDGDHQSARSASIDLLGLNIFTNCSVPAWRALHAQLRDLPLSVPVVVSEAGCLPPASDEDSSGATRDFAGEAVVLGAEFTDVFSGVSVFEWAVRATGGGYGIVRYGEGDAEQQLQQQQPELEALAGAFGGAEVAGTPREVYLSSSFGTVSPPACPTEDAARGWLVDADAALPTIAGLRIETVTARTTVAGGTPTGSSGTSSSVTGTSGRATDLGERERTAAYAQGGLSKGAIAGIVVGCVAVVLGLVTGVLVCLRRRGKGAAHDEGKLGQELPSNERLPGYPYPMSKALELPAQAKAAAEMEGSPYSTNSSINGLRKMPMEDARQDSPTVTELSAGNWKRQTTRYELEGNYVMPAGDDTDAGTWLDSPVTPGIKYA